MKISNCLFTLAVLAIGAGCQSAHTDASSRSSSSSDVTQTSEVSTQTAEGAPAQHGTIVQQGSTPDVNYTIEMIPNPRLTATSREGDKPTEVYSSNIIAVYVHPKQGVTVTSTNSSAAGQSQKK
jgi:hypothetical protein